MFKAIPQIVPLWFWLGRGGRAVAKTLLCSVYFFCWRTLCDLLGPINDQMSLFEQFCIKKLSCKYWHFCCRGSSGKYYFFLDHTHSIVSFYIIISLTFIWSIQNPIPMFCANFLWKLVICIRRKRLNTSTLHTNNGWKENLTYIYRVDKKLSKMYHI